MSLETWLRAAGKLPPDGEVSRFSWPGAREALVVRHRSAMAPNEFYYFATNNWAYALTPLGDGSTMLGTFGPISNSLAREDEGEPHTFSTRVAKVCVQCDDVQGPDTAAAACSAVRSCMMRRRFLTRTAVFAIGMLVTCAALFTTGCGGSPTGPDGNTHIRGQVVDRIYRPLAGALIEVVEGPLAGMTKLTDAAGRFELRGSAGDRTTVRVSRDGFHTRTQALSTTDQPFWLDALEPSIGLDPGAYTLTLAIDLAKASSWIAQAPCAGFPVELASRSYPVTIAEASFPLAVYNRLVNSDPPILPGTTCFPKHSSGSAPWDASWDSSGTTRYSRSSLDSVTCGLAERLRRPNRRASTARRCPSLFMAASLTVERNRLRAVIAGTSAPRRLWSITRAHRTTPRWSSRSGKARCCNRSEEVGLPVHIRIPTVREPTPVAGHDSRPRRVATDPRPESREFGGSGQLSYYCRVFVGTIRPDAVAVSRGV